MTTHTSKRRRLFLGERGSIAIQTALILTALLGMVALGAEISTLLLQHRRMQTAADQAAIAAASALNSGTDYTTEADAVSAAHSFTNGVDGTVVTVNRGPTSGPHAGDQDYVEVFISQPQSFSLANLFHEGPFTPKARAVAGRNAGVSTSFCMLALNSSAAQSVFLKNNVAMANATCGIAANSTNNRAIYLENNASISGPVYTSGNVFLSNGAALAESPQTHQEPMPDPYAGVIIPATGACQTAIDTSGVVNLSLAGGNCWLGWTLTGSHGVINLTQAGVYYVRNALSLGSGAILRGTVPGVTVVFDNNFGIDLNPGASITLTAPTTGDFQGLALVGRSTVTATQKFLNNANLNIVGAIYFPGALVEFDNNLITSASKCTQLIANKLRFMNNVGFNYDCAGTGVRPITAGSSALTE